MLNTLPAVVFIPKAVGTTWSKTSAGDSIQPSCKHKPDQPADTTLRMRLSLSPLLRETEGGTEGRSEEGRRK